MRLLRPIKHYLIVQTSIHAVGKILFPSFRNVLALSRSTQLDRAQTNELIRDNAKQNDDHEYKLAYMKVQSIC